MGYDEAAGMLDYCRRVEAGPHDDLWVIDHPWFPKACTASLARLAGGPLRSGRGHLAGRAGDCGFGAPPAPPGDPGKGDRLDPPALGGTVPVRVAVGWDPAEFEAVDVPLRERGKRTDEAIRLIRLLLTEEEVTFRGRFWEVKGVTIHPRIPDPPPLWVPAGR